MSDNSEKKLEDNLLTQQDVAALNRKLEYYERQVQVLQKENKQLTHKALEERANYEAVVNSRSWKITRPFRALMTGLRRVIDSNRLTLFVYRGFAYMRRYGIIQTFRRALAGIQGEATEKDWNRALTGEQRRYQREYIFERPIKISILVPLYNTDKVFLKEMLDSVTAQTYQNWELCLADASDKEHAAVGDICREYARKDERVLYRKLESNKGISENTNACANMATGDYIALLDHDDRLSEDALFEVVKGYNQTFADFIYSDEALFEKDIRKAKAYHLKPDFSPDTLRSYNYICHLSAFNREIFERIGRFRPKCDGSQDYDLALRFSEQTDNILHISKVLYYWRAHAQSVADDVSVKSYCLDAAQEALRDHLKNMNLKGTVKNAKCPSTYKIEYEINGEPLISILIPTCDHVDDLKLCITSIQGVSSYRNYEIIVIENNSKSEETFAYYKELENEDRIRIVYWDGPFNYSAINNYGFQYARGEYILLLNNDVEVINSDWLQEMLMYAQRNDVGAVGAKLYYPDDTIQHAGVIVGLGGVAGHSHKNFLRTDNGYLFRLQIVQNLSAVTAACMMIPRHVYEEVHGLDEEFEVAFNDVDLCMRIRQAGYLIVFTPYTELYHYESKSRGFEDTKEKQLRFAGEIERFKERWKDFLDKGDPYYNRNLTLQREDFSLK